MYILSTTSGFHLGDAIAQIFFLIIVVSLAIGIYKLIKRTKKSDQQLNRIEEKIDRFSNDKNE